MMEKPVRKPHPSVEEPEVPVRPKPRYVKPLPPKTDTKKSTPMKVPGPPPRKKKP